MALGEAIKERIRYFFYELTLPKEMRGDSRIEKIRYFFYELTLPKEIRQIDKILDRLLKAEGSIFNTIIQEKYHYIFEGIRDYHRKLLDIRYDLFCKWEIEKDSGDLTDEEKLKLEKEKPAPEGIIGLEKFMEEDSWIQGLRFNIEEHIRYTLRDIKKVLIKATRRR